MGEIEKLNAEINAKVTSAVLFWTYIFLGLLTEGFILWLFPYTGLGGLICWPTALFFSFAFAFSILRIHKKLKRRRLTFICFIAFLSLQILIQILRTPQEIGGDPIKQISEAISTYRQFDKIDFSEFRKLKQFERVAYIFKNQKSLPDSYLILSIDSLNDKHLLPGDSNFYTKSSTYLIEVRNGKRSWNTNKLGIIETDSSTIIIQRNGQRDSVVYETVDNLLRGRVGGGDDSLSISCDVDDFKLNTGLQEVFYDILTLTKRRPE